MKLPNYAGQIWSKRIAILQPILESFGIKDMQSIAIEEDAAISKIILASSHELFLM